jgi:hypothetical protein
LDVDAAASAQDKELGDPRAGCHALDLAPAATPRLKA